METAMYYSHAKVKNNTKTARSVLVAYSYYYYYVHIPGCSPATVFEHNAAIPFSGRKLCCWPSQARAVCHHPFFPGEKHAKPSLSRARLCRWPGRARALRRATPSPTPPGLKRPSIVYPFVKFDLWKFINFRVRATTPAAIRAKLSVHYNILAIRPSAREP